MDDCDRIILGEPIRNGRATFKEPGALAGLSTHAVAPRVRRLVDAGIVTSLHGTSSTTATSAAGSTR